VVVAPDDVPADHTGLLLVAGMIGAVQCEVPQRGELRLYAGHVAPVPSRMALVNLAQSSGKPTLVIPLIAVATDYVEIRSSVGALTCIPN
jgi:hypothetical protein